jgi:carbonic anhydrase
MNYKEIFRNNETWVKDKLALDSSYFEKLAEGQHPEHLFIGCSDSRVTAEDLMGAMPGEVFIHRNVANLVPNNDNNSASVIEYAVGHLKVKHIIVCGHYLCGGVAAAMQSTDMGSLNPWLRNIRDVYRLHHDELNAIRDENQKYNRLVELNVQEQCINIIKMAVWQKSFIASEGPTVHGVVFDIKTGKVIDLEIDFQKELHDLRAIYDLGTNKV